MTYIQIIEFKDLRGGRYDMNPHMCAKILVHQGVFKNKVFELRGIGQLSLLFQQLEKQHTKLPVDEVWLQRFEKTMETHR